MPDDGSDSLDSIERVRADLATLPPMRPRYVEAYLDGGGESAPVTLGVIREMRQTGWPEDAARSMMCRWPAKGARWLLDQEDPEAEFDRCWELAAVPVSQFQKPRRSKPFVSNAGDQMKVLAYVEAQPGLGTRDLLRAGCGLEGVHLEGRIKAALKVLREQGRIRQEPGPGRRVLHYVVEGSVSQRPTSTSFSATPIGGKRYATPGGRKRGAKVWKHYQGLTIMHWRAWVLLRRIADLSTLGGALFPSLRDEGIVKPTVLWKYLCALEQSGLVILSEEDVHGKVLWTARAVSPEAVEAALSAGTVSDEDRSLWERLRAFYEAQKPATDQPAISLDDLLAAPSSKRLTLDEIKAMAGSERERALMARGRLRCSFCSRFSF